MKLCRFSLVVSLLLLLPACVKEQQLDRAPGSPIVFGAGTFYDTGSETRTEYSGEMYDVVSGTETKRIERIDWVKDYDWIRIFCQQAEDGPSSDYAIRDTPSSASQVSSVASVTPLVRYGLHWGTGTHYFYALYPASGMKSNYQFKAESASTYTDRTVDASEAKIEEVSGDATKAKVTGVIPATQEVRLVRGSDSTPAKDFDEYKANMNYAYMYARAKVNPSSGSGAVTLAFKPLVTTYEFTLLAERDNAVGSNLTQVKLSSGSSTMNKLSGTFTATLSETGDPAIASVGSTGNAITVKLPDGGVRLSETVPLKITILTLPFAQSELTLELKFADNTTRSLALKRKNPATGAMEYVSVEACKKLYVRNVGVPEYMYYLEPAGPTVTLDDADGTEAQILRLVSASAGTTGTAPFRSYRIEAGKTLESHPSSAEAVDAVSYQYALADASGNPEKVSGTDQINWRDAPLPSGLGWTMTGTGITRDAAAQVGAYSGTAVTGVLEDNLRRERLLENTDLYGLASDQDLSLYDITNLHTPRASGKPTTANCYIVDRAGTYIFPAVYGNAIDWSRTDKTWSGANKSGVNIFAYQDALSPASNGYEVMHHFQNHGAGITGYYISSPYVVEDGNTTYDNVEAVVVWEDVENLITITGSGVFDNSDVSGKFFGLDSNKNPVQKSSVPYIRFTISRQNIRQGNAVIALRYKNAGEILWSWHIWVTDGNDADGDGKGDGLDPIHVKIGTVGASGISSDYMMPFNIGWCSYNTVTRYPDRVWYVRVHHTVGNAKPLVFKVIQAPPVTVTQYRGGDVYYQWGRKDPFLPSDGYTAVRLNGEGSYYGLNKDAYSPAGFTVHAASAYDAAKGAVRNIVFEDNSTVQPDVDGSHTFVGGVLYYAIRNPYCYYVCDEPGNNTGRGSYNNWFSGTWDYNLWNMNNGSTTDSDVKVAKTVYDPCPPGYCVPHLTSFTYLTNARRTWIRESTSVKPFAFDFETGYGSEKIRFYQTGVRDGISAPGVMYSVREDGLSWTATPQERKNTGSAEKPVMRALCYNLYFDNANSADGVQPMHRNHRAQSFPVRPVKEQ